MRERGEGLLGVWAGADGIPRPMKVSGDCVGLGTAFEVARSMSGHEGIEGLSVSVLGETLRHMVTDE